MADMMIEKISSTPLEAPEKETSSAGPSVGGFKKALSQSIDEMNQMLQKSDQYAQEMASGQRDIHETMIAIEEAHISLRLMIQVRNKIIAAYDEIMRMQF